MAVFPQDWLQELLSKSDLAAIASEYTPLKPKGRRLWGCCPFHSEKTPSFSVTPDNQLYYCFGCHSGGGVIQFVMEAERLTYTEAVKSLAQRAGMELPQEMDDANLRQERMQKERLYAACKEAARFYVKQLLGEGGKKARTYLIRRGVDSAAVKAFGLGYAPPGWDNLANYMAGLGISSDTLVEAGLAIQGKKGSIYDAYRDRVIFPIIAPGGRVLGFGARAMGDETPKYLNTGDTPIFNKRYNLYGLNLQKGKHLSDLILVEGYMDVVSLYEGGVHNAVASLGTALTSHQARLMKRYAARTYICYDGDAAGRSATLRAMDILQAEGMEVRIISIPGGQDPDEYIRQNGTDAFLACKDSAKGRDQYKLDVLWEEADPNDPDSREKYAKQACAFLNTLQPVARDRYVDTIARRTGYSPEAVRAQCAIGRGPAENKTGKNRHTNQNKEAKARTPAHTLEVALLACMIQKEEALLAAMGRMQELEVAFPTEELTTLAERLLAEKPDISLLLGQLPAQPAALLAQAMERRADIIDPVATALDCVDRLARTALEGRIAALGAAYGSDPAAGQELARLQQQLGKLARRD